MVLPAIGLFGVVFAVTLVLALTTSREQFHWTSPTASASQRGPEIARPFTLAAAPLKIGVPRKPAAASPAHAAIEGEARFDVRTPGAQVTVRRRDHPRDADQPVVSGVLRLPVGRWIVKATAPGCRPYKTLLSVRANRAARVVVKLRESRHFHRRHSLSA